MSSEGAVQVRALVGAAQQAMLAGAAEEAARIWEQVLAAAPEHSQALFHLGQYALMRREPVRARSLLERAGQAAPEDPAIPLNLSFVFRATGERHAEMAALTDALTIDPYFYPALLAKAMLLERTGQMKEAARVYKNVLTIAPPEDQIAAELRGPLKRAREAVAENASALEQFLDARLAEATSRYRGEDLPRFEECKEIALGRKKVFTQQPTMLYVPQLPAVQFYPRGPFPWLAELVAATDTIREELLVVLREDSTKMRPYVLHPDGAPLNQWAELNRSVRWSVFFLWEHGAPVAAHCARCPRTAAILQSLPLMKLGDFSPNVMFSILAPHTRIPAHTGDTNARLVGHLPLIVPPKCWFRVGNETREWRCGEAWIFDDTIEHEASNDSDEIRVIMIFDVWNPYLTAAERELVTALLTGITEYYREPAKRPS
jgi:aspartyl/asparaginyl beta-hydroxylase (cupin superfamily)